MPLYEYQCETCGEVIEVMQRLGEPELQRCGDFCAHVGGEGRVARILSVTNVGRAGSAGGASEAALCGSCGRTPGSCAWDN